ncbi:MAG: hypothetical protein EOQ44_25420 [Mesorhizobium sp.]|uniref:hypothetical protein n=1 Tax=Mesorhizobium sp. TaxID=1871066 RepID=UPI000FE6B21D|nr:hypothetical protein [Mesorhizobium sp.]RWB40481.1 MAG: hypothetical protein EOQ44_25420 [Mesorhizobium sp.]
MSNLFGNLNNDGLEESQDRLGGFRVLESGPYLVTIMAAYAGQAPSGARSVTLLTKADEGGAEYRETTFVTNKKGENFYVKDGKKFALPGFTTIDDICHMTTGKGLAGQSAEDKVMNIYDPDQKKEVPKSVPMLVELLGKKVTLGILKKLVNKQVKNATTNEYEDTADSREENSIDKVFHYPSNLTMVEARNKIQEPKFFAQWVELNKGKTQDRRSIKDGQGGQNGRSGRPGAPPKAGDSAAKTTSLFG